MKGMFKRALAGVAAAALAATGLALGAGAANAAPDTEARITVHNAQPGHTYTAYRFATFANASDNADGTTSYVSVDTVKEAGNDWTQALTSAFAAVTDFTLDSEYENNPAAAVALLTPQQLRTFAGALSPVGQYAGSENFTGSEPGDVTLDVFEGWYVVTDTWTTTEGEQSGAKAIVATAVNGANHLTLKLDNGQLGIDALGEVNAKNVDDVPDPGDKEASKINGVDAGEAGTVDFGDVVTYTVTDQIPEIAAASNPYSFTFTDHASKGLDIDAESIQVEVSADEQFTTPNVLELSDDDKSVVTDPETGVTTTTVTVPDVHAYAGQWIRLSYEATVTKDAEDGKVENTAYVGHNGVNDTTGDFETLYYGSFEFEKINKENQGLSGVVFNVYKGAEPELGELLTFSADGEQAGRYVYDAAATGSADVVTGEDGMLAIRGLAEGTYTVVETNNPNKEYAQNYLAKFTVTVENDGTTTINDDDDNNLVGDRDNDNVKDVLNVRNVTELPLTGAAGTALFTVLGLLIAGAGALVYMKSRNVKRALRG